MILVATSDHPFYLWQVLVQMHALRGQAARWLLYCPSGQPSPLLAAVMAAGVGDVTAWPDWQRDKTYNPAMKPWLVGKYLAANPDAGPVTIIDPDVIPTGQPLPEPREGVLIGTDTDSYTGPAWLDSKGVLEPLCDIVGVDPDRVRQATGIGAQYVTHGIPGAWWEQVAETSARAYRLLKAHPVDAQPWCAEMYVTHLAAVRDGYTPTPDERMAMVWADGPATGWETCGFFHDAGVTEPRPGVFHKGAWQGSPFGRDVPAVAGNAGARYVDHIRATERDWPHLTTLWEDT